MQSSQALDIQAPIATKKSGFTLIELSIVLVIIGLIVGGVLVGQDLIKAAEIRATISQVERYNAAVNTFRNKYNGYPGDLASAANFGFTQAASPTSLQGNGLIESCTAGDGILFGCENKMFWNHLSSANLVDASITDTTVTAAYAAVTFSATIAPTAKSGRGGYWTVGTAASGATSGTGLNYFRLVSPSAATSSGAITTNGSLSPLDAFQVDTKMDDGNPSVGIVIGPSASGTALTDTVATGATTQCASTTALYNVSGTTATNQQCVIRIRTSF